ncbi:MAG TPA: hypothetical protein VLE89_03550 [Chlamydiales bacterium]|nr:hypothetical protein [Chlamydiales bacterium]
MSFCNIVSHTFLDRATMHGAPRDEFSVDPENVCRGHLLTDPRAKALRERVVKPLVNGNRITLHDYLSGQTHFRERGVFWGKGTDELPLFDPGSRVIHFQTGNNTSLVLKGQDPPLEEDPDLEEDEGQIKAVLTPSGIAFSPAYDHFARLKMGDRMRTLQQNENLDRLEIARDYAIEAPWPNLPLKEKYYIASDFISGLLSSDEGLRELGVLPLEEKKQLIGQIATMILKSSYMDAHFNNILFKKNNQGQLIAVFVDLEPFGLLRTKKEFRKGNDELSENLQRAIHQKNPKATMPTSLEECSRIGLESLGLEFAATHEEGLIQKETLDIAKEIIGQALLTLQTKIDSFQTTPLFSTNPCNCLDASCCAPCLCIKACKIWEDTHYSSKEKRPPPHQFMESFNLSI